MGVVYRAYHAELERTGAVKVLMALSPDEETTARFRREAQSIAHMRHPNVLNVFDFGQFEGTPYMIVEYVEGGTLAGRLRRASLSPQEALNYLRGIGSALDYAHSLGIVHRDVKPANVLIGPNDTPILADFGLAKLLQSSSIKSITGVTTGTPAYMSPEQVTGGEVGPPADRYSLAVMAYEMLSGSLPFADAGVLEVLYAHVHREPPHPSSRNTTLSSRVDAIILRGLHKNPESRWATCEEFVDALEHALIPAIPEAARTVAYAPAVLAVAATQHAAPPVPHSTRESATATMIAPAPAAPPVTTPAPAATMIAAAAQPPEKKRRRRFMWIGAVVTILVLLLGLTAAFIVGRAPRIDVSPQIVARGELVRVTATNVPANQLGDLELHSVIHTFEFRANTSGRVDTQIRIPLDVELGNHRIDLCWSSACRASTQVRVVAGGGGVPLTSPTPSSSSSGSPSPTPSATPGTTPGKSPSPKPSSNPTHQPTSSPSPRPTPRPSPSPTPTSNPCPGNSNALVLTPKSQTFLVTGGTANFKGANFTPNSTVTVSYQKGGSTPVALPSVKATCAGGISVSASIGGGLARTDYIQVCDVVKHCVTETDTVV